MNAKALSDSVIKVNGLKPATNHPTPKSKKKQTRHLKVYPKYFQRSYESVIFPEIRLCGKWVQESGFSCGQPVTVQYEPNRIIITTGGPSKIQ